MGESAFVAQSRRQESTSQTSHRHNNAQVRMSTWSAQSCLDSHLQDCARNPRQAVLAVETLTDLWGLLGSCFRRNDECWIFAQSRKQEANPPSFLRRQESTSQTSHRHNNAQVRMSTWSAQSCLDSHLQDCARNPRQAVLAVETLTDLWGLLGSCFRRNDECWIFAQISK